MADTKQKIMLYENTDQSVIAAIDKIVVGIINKRTEKNQAQVVLMTGCSPIAGTTTTCIGASIAMANTGRKTLLIDCDMRKALKYKKLNENASNGLAEYLMQFGVKEVDEVTYGTNIPYLSYIPCGSHIENPTRRLCASGMTDLLNYAREYYDCVILDLPSVNVVPDAEILFGEADGIVLISALGDTRKKQIKEAKRKVAPFADRYYGMIVNKVEKDMYKANERDYDYYFVGKNGEQQLTGSTAPKKYKKLGKKDGGQN